MAYGLALYGFLSIVELYITVPQRKFAQTDQQKGGKIPSSASFFKHIFLKRIYFLIVSPQMTPVPHHSLMCPEMSLDQEPWIMKRTAWET